MGVNLCVLDWSRGGSVFSFAGKEKNKVKLTLWSVYDIGFDFSTLDREVKKVID